MSDRETRKKDLTARRQEQILAAALEIFIHKGYSAATIPEIAHQAGLAAGTIYLYFPSKRDLFIKVVETLIVSPLLGIFENVTTENFESTMRAAMENRLEFFRSSYMSRLMLLMSEIQRDPELKNHFNQTLVQPLFQRMSRIFGAQTQSGAFRPVDPEIIPRLVGSLMIGLAMIQNLEGEASPFHKMTLEQMSSEIMHFVMLGILKQPSQPTTKEV
jgi:AcrR family transcriptional regulator